MIHQYPFAFKVFEGNYFVDAFETYRAARNFILAKYPGGHFASDTNSFRYYLAHSFVDIVPDKHYQG